MHVTKRTESNIDRAVALLCEVFGDADGEPVSRRMTLQRRGGQGRAARDERRRWAEAWQLLEQSRLICRDVDESRPSEWFLTGAGRQALKGGDIEGAIMLSRRF